MCKPRLLRNCNDIDAKCFLSLHFLFAFFLFTALCARIIFQFATYDELSSARFPDLSGSLMRDELFMCDSVMFWTVDDNAHTLPGIFPSRAQ